MQKQKKGANPSYNKSVKVSKNPTPANRKMNTPATVSKNPTNPNYCPNPELKGRITKK